MAALKAEMSYREKAEKRGCYCDVWDNKEAPKYLIEQGLPEGFCGKCERCGANGHTRHYPGPAPYTGAWCDDCYRLLGKTWFFRLPMFWLVLIGVLIYGFFKISVQSFN
ncbi:hypothetical protein ACJJIR_01370 [Microbulbifer sp. SSSA008]|uniref:hypothetical protein n=1 Tax=Microbulbifer sp. SSSA008 TaxID=3243380 RepID=UPI00403A3D93